MALTDQAHRLITEHFNQVVFRDGGQPLNLAVDATVGNGHDTEFLALLKFRKVIGFDIQALAIQATRRRLDHAGVDNVLLLEQSHANLGKLVQKPIDCVVFNLGYLPSADKAITTSKATTLAALDGALNRLSPNGLISIICYPGHPAGAEETAAVKDWFSALDSHWKVHTLLSSDPDPTTPILFILCKTIR